MCNHASGQLLPEHTWSPRCAQKFSWTHVQQDMRATAARAHAKTPPPGSPSAHRAQRDVHATDCCARMPHLDLTPCAKRHVPAKRLLRGHAARTLGSLSVRKLACSCDNTAAFASCEHTWISLRAQRDMFRRKNCCARTLRAHLDLSPCARRPVHATTLLRSHAVSTLRSHSLRKEACSGEQTAVFSRREHTWISLRAQRDKTCSCDRLLRSHAASTLGSLSVRKGTRHVHATDCCVRTPHAHLDLFPCASKKTCSCDRLLRSHATSTLGSLYAKRQVPSKRLLQSRAAAQDR